MFKQYQRKGLSEMRPYVPGENLVGISVSPEDTPELGGMIARNPKNHADQWYVAKKYFEENLEEVTTDKSSGLSFGEALKAVKEGKLIARKGWNGKGMFIFMRPEDELSAEMVVNKVKSLPQAVKDYFTKDFAWTQQEALNGNGPDNKFVKFTAYLCMKAADGTIVNGWLASQTDMLAEDWEIL